MPASAGAISFPTFSTARSTPLPRYAPASPSRSSTASNCPVEAPDGTAARPTAPDSSRTSTSTVGFPRESRIWRAPTAAIGLLNPQLFLRRVEVAVLLLQRKLGEPPALCRRELFGQLNAVGEAPGHR